MRGLTAVVSVLWILRVAISAIGASFFLACCSFPLSGRQFLAAVAVFLMMGSTFIINDLLDCKSDKLNHPRRALPSGRLAPQSAKLLALLTSLAGLAICALLSVRLLGFALWFTATLISYSYLWRKWWPVKNAGVALTYASIALAPGIAFPGTHIEWPRFLLAGLLLFAREVQMDIADADGDRACGLRTLVHVLGVMPSSILSAVSLVAFAVLYLQRAAALGHLPVGLLVLVFYIGLAVGTAVSPRAWRWAHTAVTETAKIGMLILIASVFLRLS